MLQGKVLAWFRAHLRLVSYVVASGFISIWTLLQFFTQRTIFDLVGQQVMAQQWLHGQIAGAGIGTTNYIPKIFLLYMPLHLLPGSPRLKLILLTIIVNVVTMVLLGLISERILREFKVRVGVVFYLALVWLSAIAGSVFWVQFTNSRNLEVVGGLFILLLGLRYISQPNTKKLVGIASFGSLLFFADPLQVYMTALPIVAYCLIVPSTINRFRRTFLLGFSLVVAVIGSKILFTVCRHVFSLHYLQANTGVSLSFHFWGQGLTGSIKALAHLYAGGAEAGRLREVCNVLFVGIAAIGVTYAVWRRLVSRRILFLGGLYLVIDIFVYIASGEAQQPDTQRYLIMTAPALVLLVGSLQKLWNKFRLVTVTIALVLIAVNGISLGRAVAQGSELHFSQDAHLASVERYVSQSPNILYYASMDTSLPTAYLSGSDADAPLPLSCTPTGLVRSTTFYSSSAYHAQESQYHHSIAIILDGAEIVNAPSVCSKTAILAQLGHPQSAATTDDGSMVLIYTKTSSIELPFN